MASFKSIKWMVITGCVSFLSGQASYSKTWYEGPDVGWSWYKDPKPAARRPSPKKESAQQAEKSSPQDDYIHTQQVQKNQKLFEEAVSKAILHPTLENVQEAQRLYNGIITRSSDFERAWMVASLLSADGYRESDQHSPQHRKVYQERRDQNLEADIRSLVKTYGIFFIFKQDCPYCHQMAPTVKTLQEVYGFNIKAISPDGQPLTDFPDAVADNGTIGQVNPEGIFPMVILVNPHTREVIPLARGLTSPSELKENFSVIIRYLKEQRHVS